MAAGGGSDGDGGSLARAETEPGTPGSDEAIVEQTVEQTVELRSRNPLTRVAPEQRTRWLMWAVVAVVVSGAFMTAVSQDLRGNSMPSIVEFELAENAGRSSEIIESWGEDGTRAALASLWADFPFLISYSIALGLACLVVSARSLRRGWLVVSRTGLVMAWASMIAGLLDAGENAFLISELATGPTARQVAGARTAASTKFVLVVLVLAYVAVAWVATWERFAPAGATGGGGEPDAA